MLVGQERVKLSFQSNQLSFITHPLSVFHVFFLVIKEEAVDSRAEVKSFNKSGLKHVETEEKHFMPSAQGKLLCSSSHCNNDNY